MSARRNGGAGGRPALDVRDLAPELLEQLETRLGRRVVTPRRPSMSKDLVRSYALRVIAVIAELRPSDRRRVLHQALKVNDV